jgi:hypothetical protein
LIGSVRGSGWVACCRPVGVVAVSVPVWPLKSKFQPGASFRTWW